MDKEHMEQEDLLFFNKVVDQYKESKSIRDVSIKLFLSRSKVRKILITMGVLKSEITEKALRYIELGHSQQEIAELLSVSEATLSTYLPYGNRVLNREVKSNDAIRCENYRARQAVAANKQVHRNTAATSKITDTSIASKLALAEDKKEEDANMDAMNFVDDEKVLKLRLTLDTANCDSDELEVLKKYGKVKEGITREVMVSSKQSLHQLHYMIQKLFGWQNSHLHSFRLFDEDMEKLVQNSFKRYCRLCGIYFRFFYNDSSDLDDVYWDDNYEEGESFKSWLKKKYRGIQPYRGSMEHYIIAQDRVKRYVDEDALLEVQPSFAEWSEGRNEIRKVRFEEATYQEMFYNYDCNLGELVERACLGNVLTLRDSDFADSAAVTEVLEWQEKAFNGYWAEFCELLSLGNEIKAKQEKLHKNEKRKNANRLNLILLEEEINMLYRQYSRDYNLLFMHSDKAALPITNKLCYKYDYGDGWEVKIEVVDEYIMDEIQRDELVKQVYEIDVPVCVAADGLSVLDDVGGIHGYCMFLKGINKKKNSSTNDDIGSSLYDNPMESKAWARSLGWTGRMSRPENML